MTSAQASSRAHLLLEWIAGIARENHLKHRETFVLTAMALWANNETGQLEPAAATIAGHWNISVGAVTAARKILAQKGVIEIIDDRGGFKQGSVVRINGWAERYSKTFDRPHVSAKRIRRSSTTSQNPHRTTTPSENETPRKGSSPSKRESPRRSGSPAKSPTRTTSASTTPISTKERKKKEEEPKRNSDKPAESPKPRSRAVTKEPKSYLNQRRTPSPSPVKYRKLILRALSDAGRDGLSFHELKRTLGDLTAVSDPGRFELRLSDDVDNLEEAGDVVVDENDRIALRSSSLQ